MRTVDAHVETSAGAGNCVKKEGAFVLEGCAAFHAIVLWLTMFYLVVIY